MHLDPRLLRLARQGRLALLLTIGLGLSAGVLAIAQAGALSRVIDQVFLEEKTLAEVAGLLLVLLGILVLRALLSLGSDLTAQTTARRVKSGLRSRLLDQIQARGPGAAHGEQTGELTNTLVEGVEALDAYYSQYLPGLALAVFVPLAILIYVFRIDLLSGIVFLITGPLIPLFMALIGSMAQELTRRQWRTLSRLSAYFLDVLQGLTTLKMLGRSKGQVKQIALASEQFRQATMNVLRVTFLSALTLEMAATLSTAVVAVEIGLRLLYGRIDYGQAFMVLLLAPEFYLPLRMLGARFHAGMAGVEAARRIFEYLEPAAGMAAPGGPGEAGAAIDGRSPAGESPLCAAWRTEIRFEGVSVHYGAGRTALQGITLAIRRGEKIALVGPSGGGKSTLAALLLRFADPDEGQILVDGRPLEAIQPDAWRGGLAWVPQNPYLFNDTIEANIRLGRPHASREEVIRAAEMAEAHAFIQDLPHGYQTQVGERGARLSGGQAQRIALARAFLKEADLIILDEATANLDAENEARLQAGAQRLLAGRTALVIAHRLNTIRQADRIIVLDQGRVCQAGTHAELAVQDGLYRRMLAACEMPPESMDPGPHPAEPAGEAGRSSGEMARSPSVEENPPDGETLSYGLIKGDRLPVLGRLLRLASGIWDWAALSMLAGAATVLSGVGLMAASAYIITAAALHPSIALLEVPIVGVRFFGITRGVFRYLERYLSHQATFRLLARLRAWFYQALEPLAPARLMRFRSGDLLSRMLGDIQSLENLYVRGLAPPLAAILALAAVFVYIFSFEARLAQALLLFWLAGGLLVPLAAHGLGRGPGRRVVARRAALNAAAVDFIQGLPDLQAFNQGRVAASQVREQSEALLRAQWELANVASLQTAASALLAGLGMWSTLFLAIPLVRLGQIDGVYLAVLALVALTSFEAVNPLPAAAQHLESSLQSARRLFEVVDAEPEVQDPAEPLRLPAEFDLQVRDLYFHYPGGEDVLRGISFDLPPGKRLAIVGQSGSGKSTLVSLLLRFWEAGRGQILLGGQDLGRYAQEELRARIGVVPQQVYLFSASLRDNLRIADPSAGEGEIARAARLACLQDFILGLPQGYDTWVGEQGTQLSGGERQRVALARALLRPGLDSPGGLLILDEGLAHLDARMERAALQSILEATEGRSLLMINHRLVGMEAMDEILVLEKGVVVERGQHAGLLARGGVYSRMWAIQNELDFGDLERLAA